MLLTQIEKDVFAVAVQLINEKSNPADIISLIYETLGLVPGQAITERQRRQLDRLREELKPYGLVITTKEFTIIEDDDDARGQRLRQTFYGGAKTRFWGHRGESHEETAQARQHF